MSESLKLEVILTKFQRHELENWQKELIQRAEEATLQAYAPYSNFCVGAAVLTHSGRIIKGNNQENSAFPSGLCAERVAIFSARAQYPEEKIKAIVVTAKKKDGESYLSVTPCGSCRQVLSEVETTQDSPIQLIMTGSDEDVFVSASIENLLPFKFSDKYLK